LTNISYPLAFMNTGPALSIVYVFSSTEFLK